MIHQYSLLSTALCFPELSRAAEIKQWSSAPWKHAGSVWVNISAHAWILGNRRSVLPDSLIDILCVFTTPRMLLYKSNSLKLLFKLIYVDIFKIMYNVVPVLFNFLIYKMLLSICQSGKKNGFINQLNCFYIYSFGRFLCLFFFFYYIYYYNYFMIT